MDETGSTPLHDAVKRGQMAVVDMLLAEGAAVGGVDKLGATALHHAAFNGNTSVIELLLAKGAAVGAADESGSTPLHYAATSGHTAAAAVVEMLLAKDASVTAVDNRHRTPLHLAACSGHTAITQLLLSKGAAIDAVNKGGMTPLHHAAACRNTEVVKLLSRKGATINAQDYNGNTPLTLATMTAEGQDDYNRDLGALTEILVCGQPLPASALIDAAKAVVQRAGHPNSAAFAHLIRALFLVDKAAVGRLLADVHIPKAGLQAAMESAIERWCFDVSDIGLDLQRAQLLETRQDVEAQRRAVQDMIVQGAALMRQMVEITGSASHEIQQ